ncbi:hypothetical protein ACFE04_028763 [Oxalis oulophora]
MRKFAKRTKDDEVRALVAWVGWVDGCLIPSAQDYLVSTINAFFFCVESNLFLPFVFPSPFTIVKIAPAITAIESDHDQEGITIFFSSCIVMFDKLLVSHAAFFVYELLDHLCLFWKLTMVNQRHLV